MNTRSARGRSLAACTAVLSGVLLLAAGQGAFATEGPTPQPSSTQSTTYDTVPDEFSLTVSPTRLVIGADDIGREQSFLVVNRGEAALHVDVSKQAFLAGEEGNLILQEDAPYSAATWLTIEPATLDLQPGEARSVVATVVVPENPEPGDHQVALVFVIPAGESSANIAINRGIAAPIYIAVPGATDDSATVSTLAAPWFSAGGPVQVTATVHSTGTVHRDFRDDAALAIAGTDAVFPDFTVVRDSTRNISTEWNPPFACICELSVSIVNEGGTSTSETVQVIVFPVALAAALLAAVAVLLVVLIVWRRRHLKSVASTATGRQTTGGDGDG